MQLDLVAVRRRRVLPVIHAVPIVLLRLRRRWPRTQQRGPRAGTAARYVAVGRPVAGLPGGTTARCVAVGRLDGDRTGQGPRVQVFYPGTSSPHRCERNRN